MKDAFLWILLVILVPVLVNEIEKRQVVSNDELLKAAPPFGILYHFEQERARREQPAETDAFERTLAAWRQVLREALNDP